MKPFFRPLLLILLNFVTAGCRRDPVVPLLNGRPVILCAGDSITAASYPKHLKKLLARDGLLVQVINAGIKGDSSAEYIRFLERSQIIERTAPIGSSCSWVPTTCASTAMPPRPNNSLKTLKPSSSVSAVIVFVTAPRRRSSWPPFRRSLWRCPGTSMPARGPALKRRSTPPSELSPGGAD